MAKNSLNQFCSIDYQIAQQKNLQEQLAKALSLMQVAIEGNFQKHPKLISELFLWSIFDFLESARISNRETLKSLKKSKYYAM